MDEKNILTGLTKQQVLAEIEDVIREMPGRDKLHWDSPEVIAWFGRATAAIENWSFAKTMPWNLAVQAVRTGRVYDDGPSKVLMILHHAQSDLRLKTVGPINTAIGQGYVFDYLATMRKLIAQAKTQVMFVDRYLNGEFVDQFLPHVGEGTSIKLLTRRDSRTERNVRALISMADAFAKQCAAHVEIRSHTDHHQRFLFVDDAFCFEFGPSFKDGPRTAGATVVEHKGTMFSDLLRSHEAMWQTGTVEFSSQAAGA